MTRAGKKARIENLWGYFFVGPQLAGILAFSILPIIAAVGISFFQWDLLTPPKFVGLENYKYELLNPDFLKALVNTLYYSALTIVPEIVIALLLAVAVNNIKGKVVYRTILFSPVVTSSVAVSVVWAWLYNNRFGLINTVLASIGIAGPNWLTDTGLVLPSIAIMTIWWSAGYDVVLFLAGLQGIPRTYYEAAEIDGASSVRQFFCVTLPLLTPTTFFVVITKIISSFQVFDQTYIMTDGGPAKASYTLVLHVYNEAFTYFKMGNASASAILLFVMILGVTIFQFVYQKKWVNYEM